MQKYPIGIQNFRKIREENYLYIDKTQQIANLIQQNAYYFLSRPRRFGKSLLLSTLKEIFSGSQDLFKGLWIENQIEWKAYPVLHLSFGNASFKEMGLEAYIRFRLDELAAEHGLPLLKQMSVGERFRELILGIGKKGKVVILIDEYDKPIVEYLGKEEIPQAIKNRDILKIFYSVVKDLDPMIRFFFMTGVSKFSKVSIFSELNHLLDITLSAKFGSLLGYTQVELDAYFGERVEEFARDQSTSKESLLSQIKTWYNGYSWNEKEKVYNPFSILCYFQGGKFHNYWFETGTPTFLVKLMRENFVYKLDEVISNEAILGNFKLEQLDSTTLLFQTGYLTIIKEEMGIYTLSYPNKEVRNSMLHYLLSEYSQESNVSPSLLYIYQSLQERDFENLQVQLNSLFTKIPYQIFEPNQESFYHAIIFLTFHLLGYYTQSEVSTSKGRIDAVVQTKEAVFVMEFKVNDSADNALLQIKEKEYYAPYQSLSKPVFLLGISCKDKGIKEIKWEEI